MLEFAPRRGKDKSRTGAVAEGELMGLFSNAGRLPIDPPPLDETVVLQVTGLSRRLDDLERLGKVDWPHALRIQFAHA
jgi:hypothetical protein